jgi:hypothetical protein
MEPWVEVALLWLCVTSNLIKRRIVGHRMNTACLARATQLGKTGVEEEFRPREAN